MRRALLGCLVLFVAACGGGVKSTTEARPEPALKNAIPTDRESALLIESLSKTFGSDAVDSCLAAWQDARGVDVDARGPVYKPGASFRTFLRACVGAPAPGDMRNDSAGDVRTQSAGDMRIQSASDMRNESAGDVRAQSAGDMRIQSTGELRSSFDAR